MFAFESDHGQLPWLDSGIYTNVTAPNGNSVMGYNGRNWEETLRAQKYLPNNPTNGLWRCPAVTSAQIDALDANGWRAGRGGYGVCSSIFRTELDTTGRPRAPLKTTKVLRPSHVWLVGDVALPFAGSVPGAGLYRRVSTSFGRPGSRGSWNFTTPASQPALRHALRANMVSFDGHASALSWPDMKTENGNFTGRGESF